MPETEELPAEIGQPKRIASILANPLLNGIGLLVGIISVILSFYLYSDGKREPQLTFCVSSAKATIVKAGQASQIKVTFDNKEIATDITATQVALWNQGKAPIRESDILKPIVLRLENNTPILEATIRKAPRDVTGLQLDKKDLQNGRLTVTWKILEHNDGGNIQLIYAGNPTVHVYADGVIEGQPELKHQMAGVTPGDRIHQLVLGWLIIVFGFPMSIFFVRDAFKYRKTSPLWLTGVGILLSVSAFMAAGFTLFFIVMAPDSGPPFGFN